MNILIIGCILLFIIYSSITLLLLYYFIKHRYIWNKTFMDITSIWTNIWSIIECPKHMIIPIPCIIYNLETCTASGIETCNYCKDEEHERNINIYQLELLGFLYKNLTNIDKTIIKNNILLSRLKQIIHILEYSIRNYKEIKTSNSELFTKLEAINKHDFDISSDINLNTYIEIENIPILEENIKLCTKILNKFKQIDINMINNTFLLKYFLVLHNIIRELSNEFCIYDLT